MFFGTFEGFENLEVCVFHTKAELDKWLAGEDQFSKHFGSVYKRKELTSKARTHNFLTGQHIISTVDADGIHWLLNRA